MKHKRFLLISLLLLFLLAACQEPPAEEPLSFETVQLQVTPGLTHWLPRVAACANQLPNFGIVTEILQPEQLDLNQADLILQLDAPIDEDGFVAVMGTENLVIIAGREVPVKALSRESVRKIFNGKFDTWDAVPEVMELGIQNNQPIQTLSYPDGHELQSLFVESFMDSKAPAIPSKIFSTNAYLKRLLADNPLAVGFVLESQLPDGAVQLRITGSEERPGERFVLAITTAEPEGSLKNLLLCLQNRP